MSDVYELLDGLRTVINDQKFADRLEQLRALEVSAKEKLDQVLAVQNEASAAYSKALDTQNETARLHNEVKQKLEPQLETVGAAAKTNQDWAVKLATREAALDQNENEHQQASTKRNNELDDYAAALASRKNALDVRDKNITEREAKLNRREASLKTALDA